MFCVSTQETAERRQRFRVVSSWRVSRFEINCQMTQERHRRRAGIDASCGMAENAYANHRLVCGRLHCVQRKILARLESSAKTAHRKLPQHFSQINCAACSKSSVTCQISVSRAETVCHSPTSACLTHSKRGVQNSRPMRTIGTSRSALPV